jgi:hypothetical protein
VRARDHFRAHARRKVNLLAGLHRIAYDGRSGEAVRIRDLGLGGACVELGDKAQPLRLDSPVTLEVTAPTLWDPLVLRGRVAWVRPGREDNPTKAGVRFEHTEQSGIFALFQLLTAHSF